VKVPGVLPVGSDEISPKKFLKHKTAQKTFKLAFKGF